MARNARPIGRAVGLNFCPYGAIYTVGAALADYLEWSRITRSPGSHYNNIVLINFHLSGPVLSEALEDFNARHLRDIAQRLLATHATRAKAGVSHIDPPADLVRRAKRVFNSIITVRDGGSSPLTPATSTVTTVTTSARTASAIQVAV